MDGPGDLPMIGGHSLPKQPHAATSRRSSSRRTSGLLDPAPADERTRAGQGPRPSGRDLALEAFGIIKRSPEDIDLTINPSAPLLARSLRRWRTISAARSANDGKALGAAAQEWVGTILLPTFGAGNRGGPGQP
jgi:hypothetical protein